MTEKQRSRIQIRNEAKILGAAQQVFAAYGFHGATVEKVAELSDMSQPNLHNYFKTKAALYEAVLDQTLDIWLDLIDGLDESGDPHKELRRYITQKVELARKYPEASRIFAGEILQGAPVLMTALQTRVRPKVRDFVRVIEAWIAQGKIRPIDATHLIFLIWGATQHYADFVPQIMAVSGLKRLNKAYFDTAADSIASLILRGLTP
jgi:TetR/AcrR family transcriptional regulator